MVAQVLGDHPEAAVAEHGDDRPVRPGHLDAHRGGQAPAHAAAVGGEVAVGLADPQVPRDPRPERVHVLHQQRLVPVERACSSATSAPDGTGDVDGPPPGMTLFVVETWRNVLSFMVVPWSEF